MRFSAGSRLSEVIRASDDPRFAFEFPRTWTKFVRSDWHDIKIDVMFYALQHKFKKDRKLKNLLKQTGNQIIVEHTKNDDFWADGGNGSGKNWLGKLLMITRLTLD
uniref:NADAR domain-containing protein n=1 Tax=Arcella intermedia TaxID=1963864 RepID=A0A6B2LSE9_9EUKA